MKTSDWIHKEKINIDELTESERIAVESFVIALKGLPRSIFIECNSAGTAELFMRAPMDAPEWANFPLKVGPTIRCKHALKWF